MGGPVEPLGELGQGLLGPSGITVVGQLKQGLVSIAPKSVRVVNNVYAFQKKAVSVVRIIGGGGGLKKIGEIFDENV